MSNVLSLFEFQILSIFIMWKSLWRKVTRSYIFIHTNFLLRVVLKYSTSMYRYDENFSIFVVFLTTKWIWEMIDGVQYWIPFRLIVVMILGSIFFERIYHCFFVKVFDWNFSRLEKYNLILFTLFSSSFMTTYNKK